MNPTSQPLSANQISAARTQLGITPSPSVSPSAPNPWSTYDTALSGGTATSTNTSGNFSPEQVGQDIGTAFNKGLEDIKAQNNPITAGAHAVGALGSVIGAAAEPLTKPLGDLGKTMATGMDSITKALSNALSPEQQTALKSHITSLLQPVADHINQMDVNHPGVNDQIVGGLKAFGDSLNLLLPQAAGEGIAAAKDFMGPEGVGGKTVDSAVTGAQNVVKGSPEAQAVEQKGVNLQALKERIMPKPTAKEARLAMDQGRLYPGSEGGVIKSGTPDQVAATTQNANSVRTIDRLIPDHAQLDDNTLYSEIKGKIGDIAQKLKPEMEKVPITDESVQKMAKDWQSIKYAQAKELEGGFHALDAKTIKTLQDSFDKKLNSGTIKNMNDVWEARQAYDDSVPENVKQANSQSSEQLQAKRQIWLQDRALFTRALTDVSTGLGDAARSSFSDMHDLYEGKNGILSKASINTEGAPSKLSQVLKHPVTKAAARVAGVGGAVRVAGSVLK